MKGKAVECMEALNALAKKENRELNASEKLEYDARKAEAEELTSAIKQLEEELAAQPPTPAPAPAPAAQPPAPAPSAPDAETLRKQAVEAERLRASQIRTMAAPFHLDEKFVNALVDEGVTVETARERIMTKLAAVAGERPNNPANPGASISADARDKLRAGMEASILFRGNPADSKLRDAGREFAGFTLVDIARECLESIGIKTRGMSRNEIARVALQGRYGAEQYFSGVGMMTTSDFPNILANVANKTLRQAYEAAPQTFKPFCRQVSASDFKPINRVQLSDVPTLPKINEKGEFHRTALSDSKETYSLATFGEIVAITRKTIVNDDLQALTRVPAGLGQAAANLESDTVWGIIINNGNMADGAALFVLAGHGNLKATNGLAAVANITAARVQMRTQKGPKGTILNLVPKYLIVPAALEGIAFQLINPINLAATAATSDVPQFVRSMIPIVEPRLDAAANGTTTWYTAADPSQIDTIEYCYLEGQQGVYIETRQGFDVDGVEIKARLDFAAGAIDYRGLQKNTA
jgi:hypothetical protein